MFFVYLPVPKEKKLSPLAKAEGGPSGPATEMEFINSNELLFLGDHGKPRYVIRPEKPAADVAGIYPEEVTIEVKATPAAPEVAETTEATPMLKADNDQDSKDVHEEEQEPKAATTSDSEEPSKAMTGNGIAHSKDKDPDKVTDTAADKVQDDPDDTIDYPAPDTSSSLLDEVGKYFDAQKTTL